MQAPLFAETYVSPAVADMQRGTLIAWSMHPSFQHADGTNFRVYVSRSGMPDDWDPVAETSNPYYVHKDRKFFAVDYKLYYRITAEDARDTGNPIHSRIIDVTRHFTARDQLLAAEIIRKERLLLEQYNGSSGILLKRRHWGVKCEACKDYDFGTPTDSKCERCFGVGFVGGYHGIDVDTPSNSTWEPYIIAITGESPDAVKTEDNSGIIGTVQPRQTVGRSLACPRLDTGDVWIDCDTDMRYILKQTRAVLFRNMPVAYSAVAMALLQSSDIVYKVPRPDTHQDIP